MTDFSPKLPIWYQLAAMLRSDIMSGRLAAGTRIEPEVRLAEQHRISVVPVRQALRALGEEGLIVRQRGRGTFVSDTVHAAEGSTPLESLYARDFDKPAQVLERGLAPVPAQFAGYFPDQPELAYVRRLAYRDERPWSYGTLYFLPKFAGEVTTALLRRWPLYRILREQSGVGVIRSQFDARATGASPDVAQAFGVDPLSPVLALSSVSFDTDERAVVAFELTFPSAPFVFSFETIHKLG
ncbi:GntR family transcriptional regulator [Sphingomonas oryzagri]|uniref:GntR family transcriptional regulator n=1 Tax=Sphingomonas oryzagri TaxID=3042314 RepID=A0ABT6MY50_9SPHN|nr:GntR family transcriptional regulator [Sphingomonas oryzagri]MDH7637742.1 GntR family transcriptional regulator [Sphingomonas oryzagri]